MATARVGVLMVLMILVVVNFTWGDPIKRETGFDAQVDQIDAGTSEIEAADDVGMVQSDEMDLADRLLPKRASLVKWYNDAVVWAKDSWDQLIGTNEAPQDGRTDPAAATPSNKTGSP